MRFTLIAAMICAVAPVSVSAEALKIAVPQKGNWETSITELGMKAGLFKAEGLDLDIVYTEGGSATVQAVISGSVDVGMQNGLLGIIGAFAKGAPVRVISAGMTGAPDLYWYARADSGIKSFKDAEGKTIAFSEVGSSTNLVVLSMIEQEKVKAKPVRAGGIPGTFTQVMSGQIDLGWAVPPFGLKDVKDGKINIVYRGASVKSLADETVRVNIVNADVLAKKRDALVKFSRAYAKSIDWVYANDQALAWYAEANGITKEIAKQTRDEFYPKTNVQYSQIKGLDIALQQAADYKFIPKPMKPDDVKGMIDILYKPGQ
jgi:NitT/TauT family transport system substrate-binding protein